MKEIRAYKLTDGSVVTDQDEAVKKQTELDIRNRLFDFWEEYEHFGDVMLSTLLDISLEKRKELVVILLNKDLPANPDLMPKLAETEEVEQDEDNEDIFGL